MILRCPHCFIDVVPAKDGTCPSCRKDTRFADPAKARLVPAEFVDGERLPNICFACGRGSVAHVESGVRQAPEVDGAGIFARILGVFGGALAVRVDAESSKKAFAVSVELPVCDEHRDTAPPAPLWFDAKTHRLTFPVHENLHAAWAKHNR